MSYRTPSQDQIDRAHEWTGEAYPDADGDRYEVLFAAALSDIQAIDAAADRAEARLAPRAEMAHG